MNGYKLLKPILFRGRMYRQGEEAPNVGQDILKIWLGNGTCAPVTAREPEKVVPDDDTLGEQPGEVKQPVQETPAEQPDGARRPEQEDQAEQTGEANQQEREAPAPAKPKTPGRPATPGAQGGGKR